MTFKELQKLIDSQPDANHTSSSSPKQLLLARLRDKSFWLWESIAHKQRARVSRGYCCFNHTIGLPRKDGIEKPLFDYEKMLYLALTQPDYLNSNTGRPGIPAHTFKLKHLWVKKATGLGVTEFMLRFMVWLCLHNDDYKGSQMVIVVGPNWDLAVKMIKRMKALFEPHNIYFDSKESVIELNGCSIQAYPSNNLGSFRSLTNPKFILIEEADYFDKSEQEEVRHVAERYIAKSDPFIVMVSTPYTPEGLFARIEKESFDICIYKKVHLDYTYGLGKIYTDEEIEKAKASPSFEREYCLKYLGKIGNTFNTSSIQRATFDSYAPGIFKQNVKTSVGVDAGFGSSKFAIVVTQLFDSKIHVMFADEFERPNFSDMIDKVWQLKHKCGHISNIYCDAANPEIIEALKREFGEEY